jgi:Carboxypeptidase regulatory-like domain
MGRSTLILCCLLFFPISSPRAQAGKAELIGEVRDQNGALVQVAKLTLTEMATGQSFSQTAGGGDYTLTNLKPGIYSLAIGADGFRKSVREGVRLATGERLASMLCSSRAQLPNPSQ